MSRALLNDRHLSNKISKNFVPFAGSVERLQPSRYGGRETTTSRWFQKHAKVAFERFAPAGWWKKFKTYQGFYVLGADGTPYSYKVVWMLTPEQVINELDKALIAYRANPPSEVEIPRPGSDSSPLRPPRGTSVLRVFSRIRPLPSGCPKSNKGVGRDHMWVTSAEVESMLKTGELPDTLVSRLVRFQLLDHVRNVSPGFDPSDVKRAHFKSKLLKGRTLEFEGDYESVGHTNEGVEFGMKGSIRGRLVLDQKNKKIVKCKAYGEARAFGESTAEAPPGSYPMVFAIVEATDSAAYRVPPTYYGLSPLFRRDYLKSTLP